MTTASIGRSVDWSIGRLVDWSIGRSVECCPTPSRFHQPSTADRCALLPFFHFGLPIDTY